MENSVSSAASLFRLLLVTLVFLQLFVKEASASELREDDRAGLLELERAVQAQNERMKAQERLLREYQVMLEQQRQEIETLKQRFSADSQAPSGSAPSPVKAVGAPRVPYPIAPVALPSAPDVYTPLRQREPAIGREAPADSPAVRPVQQSTGQASPGEETTAIEGERPRERPDVPLIVDQGGVLLRKGQVAIEPAVDFSLIETNRVEVAGFTVLPAILVGNFTVSQVERETLSAALTGRVGVTNRLELEARVPYVYRNDDETRRPIGTGSDDDETVSLDGYGLGDIEMAAHYQINDGGGGWPFFVGNVRVKSDTGTSPFDVDTDSEGNPTELPTGSGFWSVQPSLTAIMQTDPAIVFANANYTWNIKRDVDDFGEIDPGDSFGGSLGIGFALNERLSMSFAYDHSYVLETTQNGQDNNSAFHIGRMLFGGSYRFADNAAANLNFAIGVTEQAPDIQTELRVPVTFQAFGG